MPVREVHLEHVVGDESSEHIVMALLGLGLELGWSDLEVFELESLTCLTLKEFFWEEKGKRLPESLSRGPGRFIALVTSLSILDNY